MTSPLTTGLPLATDAKLTQNYNRSRTEDQCCVFCCAPLVQVDPQINNVVKNFQKKYIKTKFYCFFGNCYRQEVYPFTGNKDLWTI
jgi:hypothetical protein